jgi:hypothetical protein
MKEHLILFVELLVFGGLVALFCWVSLTKLGIGAVLAAAAVFVPKLAEKFGAKGGKALIEIGPIKVSVDGGLRFVLLVAGMVLMFMGGDTLRHDVPQAVAATLAKATNATPIDPSNAATERGLRDLRE